MVRRAVIWHSEAMQNAFALVPLLTALLIVAGGLIAFVGLRRAPEGSEDNEGFHYLHDEEGFCYRVADEPLRARLLMSHTPHGGAI
jgi:hypothetical protein